MDGANRMTALNLDPAPPPSRFERISASQRSPPISTFPQWREQQIKGCFRFCATNMLDRPPNAGLTAQASEARSRSSMIIRNGTALLKNGILSEGHDQSGNSDAIKTASICFLAGNGDICSQACLGIIQHAVSWHPLQVRPNRERHPKPTASSH